MDRVRNDKLVIMIISVATLFVAVVAISFAYFTAVNGGTVSTEMLVQTATMDSLVFSSDEQVILDVTQDNFGYGDGDVVGIAYSSVELTAGNSNSTSNYCYSMDLNILENNFEYTTSDNTPELVLSLYGSDEPFQDDDLSNATLIVDERDLTTKTTVQTLISSRDISAESGQTEHKYYKTIIKMKNLDSVQDANAGKQFIGSIVLNKIACIND